MLIVPPFLTAILNGFSVVQAQFTSGIDLVEVYTTVTDRQGQPVTGLTVPDFTVSEDGRPQSITTFAAGDFPLAVAVAIDRSFSMGDRLAVGKSAARAFVGALRPVDQVMIVAVGSETGMTTPLTTDHRAALAAIDRLDRWGTTPLYDAMAAAIGAVEPAKGRRALVLLSDGTDRYSRTSASELLDHARHSNVLIYPVAIGPARPPIFAELATATGGRSFYEKTPAKLQATMGVIARELRFQYLLGYAPARTAGDEPHWRSIEVRVNRPDVIVRARDGYFSP